MSDEHKRFQVSTEKWFSMTAKQREAHIARFDASAVDGGQSKYTTQTPTQPFSRIAGLSVSLEQAGLTTILRLTLESICSKVEYLLSKKDAIVSAPGSIAEAFMVESSTKPHPHYVSFDEKTNRITCHDCPGWKSFKICAHAFSVAEKLGKLKKYLMWHKAKRSPI